MKITKITYKDNILTVDLTDNQQITYKKFGKDLVSLCNYSAKIKKSDKNLLNLKQSILKGEPTDRYLGLIVEEL